MIDRIKLFFQDNEGSAVKAGFYYLVCRLLVRGFSFFSTPLFTRLMTKAEYGMFSNFIAWEGLLIPFLTLNLRGSINKSRYDFSEDNNSFLLSILIFAQFIVGVLLISTLFLQSTYEILTNMSISYVRMLLVFIFFHTAFDFQQIQYNIFKKYKLYVLYSIISSVLSMVLSVLLVVSMDDKTLARILGVVVPTVLVCSIIEVDIFRRSEKIRFKYIKYALAMSIPLLPSALSATILSSSDRIIITKYCDVNETALYSIAYSISGIAAILWTAMNQAWAPWLLDHLNEAKYDIIKTISNRVGLLFVSLVVGLMLIAPEILLIMGGRQYMAAIGAMPPVILAMVFQYYYAFYFDVEYFYGETYTISFGTFIAAAINLVLNFIFTPKYGYIAAAYTTLVGYAVMFIYHYGVVRFKIRKGFIFDNRFIFKIIGIAIAVQIIISFTYSFSIARYALLMIYCIAMGFVAYKNQNTIRIFFGKYIGNKFKRV